MVEVARACALVNRDALSNPKVHVTIGDARETAADDARPLRHHRVGAVQSVPRRRRQPVHVRVLPGRGRSSERRRGVRAVDPGVRDRTRTRCGRSTQRWPRCFRRSRPGTPTRATSCSWPRSGPHTYAVADLTRRLDSEPFKSALRQRLACGQTSKASWRTTWRTSRSRAWPRTRRAWRSTQTIATSSSSAWPDPSARR